MLRWFARSTAKTKVQRIEAQRRAAAVAVDDAFRRGDTRSQHAAGLAMKALTTAALRVEVAQ